MRETLTMIAATLQRLDGEGRLSARQFEECTGLSSSTYYRYLSGESEPSAATIQLLIAHHPDSQVKLILAGALLRGSGLIVHELDEQLDINGDGCIDVADALEACHKQIGTQAQMGRSLAGHMKSESGHRIGEAELALYRERHQQCISASHAQMQIVEFIYEQQHRRRKARTVRIETPIEAAMEQA